MSTQENAMPIEVAAPRADGVATSANPIWQRLTSALETAGEWLNPILVKEVRQALKSRQFSITFTLVLCLSWLWTIGGIALLPDVAFSANGPELFFGYYIILAFPLILIVPYSAFRSLIAEREDNTYELVAITTLRPRQIVGGKLGSAVAQMAVYFSAVAPCLAFTYLLRGIDVPTICFIMFYTFLASLGFSLCALLMATVAKEKHWQVMISVLIIVGLFYAFIGACAICHELLRSTRSTFNDPDFWSWNICLQMAFWSTFALFYLAAAAQLTFTSENRSTPIRIAMLGQHVLLATWFGYLVMSAHDNLYDRISAYGAIYIVLASLYWFAAGSLMNGESPELSPRVKRRLPSSLVGRAMFTWFNPGPGTGYVFAVCNLIVAALMASACAVYGERSVTGTSRGGPSLGQILEFIPLLTAYCIIYLGVSNLLLRLLRKVTTVTLSMAGIFTGMLVLAGWGIPWAIEPYSIERTSYNFFHITDPFWGCVAMVNTQVPFYFAETLLVLVVIAAAGVFFLNLLYIIPEIRHVRIAPPKRVEEEEQELAAAQHPAQAQPASPWD
jgi:hypothetical protein